MTLIVDLLGSFVTPHLFACCLLLKIATLEIRPGDSNTVREDMARLWAWFSPHWRAMVAHPLYWAATGIVTAFFLVDPLRRLFV